MKKLDSKQYKETLEEEVKRLRKESKKLSSKNGKQEDFIGKHRKDLKKRRSDNNHSRRTKSITHEPVSEHRYPLLAIQLCGLRIVVNILEILSEVVGDDTNVPCYNTIENWMKKLGLAVYQDDKPCKGEKDEMQTAYSFLKDHEALLCELRYVLDAVRYVEDICKNDGFSIFTSRKCKLHIIANVIGNAHSRQAKAGLKMLEYFEKEEKLLTKDMNINISSDIIESTFGIYKSKKSPNKLYGVTSFALIIPLYSKITNQIVTKTFNFKECLTNVKLKDVDTWRTEHLSSNWVTERTKTLKKVG